MSDTLTPEHLPVDIEQRVRENTSPAAITGAILLVYGFFVCSGPSGEGIFRTGDAIFLLGLRVGGLAMIGVAVWSAFGHLPALLADAVVSALVGLALIISDILLTKGGGFVITYALYAIFGFILLRSAVGVGMVYFSLNKESVESDEEDAPDASALSVADGDSSFLSGLRGSRDPADAASSGEFEPIAFDRTKPPTPKRRVIGDSPDEAIRLDDALPRTQSEGHLARLAKRQKGS